MSAVERRHEIPVGSARERLAVRLSLPDAPASAAPTIVYLHGFGSRQDGEKAGLFRARAAADGFAFCSFDARGHGESGGSLAGLTPSRSLEDVAAVRAWLEAQGHRRLALFGSSMGAATALWHAARNPRGICAAAHISPAVSMLAGLERWAGEEGLERWRREGRIRYRNELVDTDLEWGLVEDLRRHPFAELCAAYRTPTILFQGKQDETVDWRDVDRFVREATGAEIELVLYEGGDHRLLDRIEEIWAGARRLFLRPSAP